MLFWQIHHPFAVNPNQPTSSFHQPSLIFHNNAWKTTSQLAIEAAVTDMAKPLVEKFPVSAGLQHTREQETDTGSSNVFSQYQVCEIGDFLCFSLCESCWCSIMVRERDTVHTCFSPVWFILSMLNRFLFVCIF